MAKWIIVEDESFNGDKYYLTQCTSCGYAMNNSAFFEPWDFKYCPECGEKIENPGEYEKLVDVTDCLK